MTSTHGQPLHDVARTVIEDKQRLEEKLASTPPSLAESSLSSAAQLVVLQLGTRLLTFALNQALLRFATPAAFGTVAIQLDLFLHSTLFLAREPVRDAFLRLTTLQLKDDRVKQSAWLPVYLGIPLAWAAAGFYAWTASLAVRIQSGFYPTVLAYAIAASFEILAEPMFLRVRADLDTNKRVRIEAAAFLLKSISNVALLLVISENDMLWSFAVAQLLYGAAILGGYWVLTPCPPVTEAENRA